jgi:S-adenosylmethionine hydrolase
MGVVTLLTDFGLADTYVGQLKGAILTIAPAATLVDLTHAVPPQDVFAGAFLLWTAVEAAPPGSVHVAVVDPGVGSSRKAVAARSGRGDFFVGPDNGLLVPALDRLGGCAEAVELTQGQYWRQTQSSTFHGRDIFAPVAAHLANGVALADLGQPVELQRPFSVAISDGPHGQVLHVDAYGNLITNLRRAASASIQGQRARFVSHYAAAQPGELIALVGSSGLLEIAVRDGSAAALTGAVRGDAVELLN